jgi:N-acetylglutamate synthase-like GNAT family acetyltransferase
MQNKLMIQEVLQDSNETFFSPLSMEVVLLKDIPELIPILAQWIYDEWRFYDASLTKDKVISGLKSRLKDNGIPFTLVALKNDIPIGMISLKDKGEPEFSELAENSPWLGTLHILDEERNKGIGQELLNIATTIASQLGHEKVFVYTSNAENIGWYLKNGAQIIETRPFRGHTITIMTIPLV